MTKNIKIFDTTLRDGEQSPGCSMNQQEKLKVAFQLERLGVDIIEAGFAISSKGDFESIETIAKNIKNSRICSLCRAIEKDIETAAISIKKAESQRIHTFIATSPIHMKYKLKMSQENVINNAIQAVKKAKSFVSDVEFSCEDAGRSDKDFLVKILSEVIKAGATVINIPDTVGYMTPDEYGQLINYIATHTSGVENVDISVHCHNDLGFATANSIAGVINGANQIECTINGIGERAGNTALEEVVMALNVRQSFLNAEAKNIKTTELLKTSKLVSTITGSVVQANKAIVGANAFAHEAGIHQDGMLKNASTYEIMTPESIGLLKTNLVLGKHSGRHAFKDKMTELGYQLDNEEFESTFKRFKTICDKKKQIHDDDLHSLIHENQNNEHEIYTLIQFHVESNSTSQPKATVTLEKDGRAFEDHATGAGAVDALYKTIDKIVETKFELIDYVIQAVTEGTDALGDVIVRIKFNNRIFRGRGSSTDVINASAKAYINAINKLLYAQTFTHDKPEL